MTPLQRAGEIFSLIEKETGYVFYGRNQSKNRKKAIVIVAQVITEERDKTVGECLGVVNKCPRHLFQEPLAEDHEFIDTCDLFKGFQALKSQPKP